MTVNARTKPQSRFKAVAEFRPLFPANLLVQRSVAGQPVANQRQDENQTEKKIIQLDNVLALGE
jgi:hypothetical protein